MFLALFMYELIYLSLVTGKTTCEAV